MRYMDVYNVGLAIKFYMNEKMTEMSHIGQIECAIRLALHKILMLHLMFIFAPSFVDTQTQTTSKNNKWNATMSI